MTDLFTSQSFQWGAHNYVYSAFQHAELNLIILSAVDRAYRKIGKTLGVGLEGGAALGRRDGLALFAADHQVFVVLAILVMLMAKTKKKM